MKDLGRLSCALFYEDLPLGTTWKSAGRTVLESDLTAYIGLSWFHEDLFTNQHDRVGMALKGRPVPGALIFIMAEGLVLPSIDGSGLAFLHADMDIKKGTSVGDTIYVGCEVVESRLTSKGDRALVRTRNTVTNASGDPVMVYQPLRLMKLRASAKP